MSTNHGPSSGRRHGRGGQRRQRSDRRDDQRSSSRPQSQSSAPAPAPAAKPSLLQKILSFFRPKPAPSSSSPKNSARPPSRGASSVTSSYPNLPRENRESGEGRESRGPRPDRAPREDRENRGPRERSPRPVRKPEAVEVTTPKLYIGNLSFEATESDLSELFAGVGVVRASEIVTHKDTERSKGFGFVTMASIDEAKRAVAELHDKDFMGRKLVVSGAKTPADRL